MTTPAKHKVSRPESPQGKVKETRQYHGLCPCDLGHHLQIYEHYKDGWWVKCRPKDASRGVESLAPECTKTPVTSPPKESIRVPRNKPIPLEVRIWINKNILAILPWFGRKGVQHSTQEISDPMPLFKLDKLDKLEERKDTEELKELKELKELGRDSLFGIHASPGGILLWSICHMALFFWGPPGLHPAYVGGSMLLVTAFGISTLIAIEWISVKALFELYNLVAISNKELNKMAEDSGWQEPPEDP